MGVVNLRFHKMPEVKFQRDSSFRIKQSFVVELKEDVFNVIPRWILRDPSLQLFQGYLWEMDRGIKNIRNVLELTPTFAMALYRFLAIYGDLP